MKIQLSVQYVPICYKYYAHSRLFLGPFQYQDGVFLVCVSQPIDHFIRSTYFWKSTVFVLKWELQKLFGCHVSYPIGSLLPVHYSNVIMSTMAFQITCVAIVCSIVCSGTDKRKHQRSATLVFVREIHWWPLDCPHKGLVMLIMFPFGDGIMVKSCAILIWIDIVN